jgi:DNA-directed RNA polymerase subunit E'/Rpb7
MIITKVLETSIDLQDPDDIYTVDIHAMLKKKLLQRYEQKCFSSILILDIIQIIRHSDIIMVDNRLDGAAYINVQFKVRGVIFTNGEVLQNCQVVNVSSAGIIIKHQYAVGMMTADPTKKAISIIKKDQIVPVIINDVRYNVGKSQITITCKPYTPQPFSHVLYNINQILSPEDTEKIDIILNNIADEEKKHEALKSSKSYSFFTNLIYPYKTMRKFTISPIGSSFKPASTDLKSILTINSGCITNADSSVSDYLLHSSKHISGNSSIIGPLYPALSDILHQRLKYLVTLREFTEMYDTVEKNQSMMAYWKICMSLKE